MRGNLAVCAARRYWPYCITFLLLISIYQVYQWGILQQQIPTIIVITPTHKRPERLADMTRFSQTLSHIKNLHWVVIEDGNHTVDVVQRILDRSGLPYVYFYTTTEPGFPKRGWTHRNQGLAYVRKNYKNFNRPAVVYFADDDNSYDVRLFEKYIRNVKTIGIWAVVSIISTLSRNNVKIPSGLSGTALVEAPHVVNGTIVGWDVVYAPKRKFATDMAGFAVNLDLILNSNASFHRGCIKSVPESCFLQQFNIPKEKVQPFGFDDDPKEILVWHTKTRNIGTKGGNHGYIVE